MHNSVKPRLSICIPTLNRGEFIGATLESIVSQITEEVEIVVVDGGSTDNTAAVVSHYQQTVSGIRYLRTDKTESSGTTPSGAGFDLDCNRAVEAARGDYCWLFTDDDLLNPGAVGGVLAATRSGYGLIVVNSEVRTSDLNVCLEPSRLKMASDRLYAPADYENLFVDVAEYLTFVGGVVVRRQVWLDRDKKPYIGSGFIHLGVLFQARSSESSLVLASPLIAIRYGNAHYMRSTRYFEIWMFGFPQLIWSFDTFSEKARRRVSLKEPWRRARTLLLFRAKGAYSIEVYRELLATRLISRWDRFVARLMALFPGRLANLLEILRHYESRSTAGQSLLDYRQSPFYFAAGFWKSTARVQGTRTQTSVPVSGESS
jgi:abequosyltransferase